jgi:hypothetical protein
MLQAFHIGEVHFENQASLNSPTLFPAVLVVDESSSLLQIRDFIRRCPSKGICNLDLARMG